MRMEPITEDFVRRCARILGPACAATKAIQDFETRTAAGEDVAFYQSGQTLLVGPRVDLEIVTD